MKLKIVVDDGMIGVIKFEEVLERPSSLLLLRLDIMDLDWFNSYRSARIASKEAREAEWIRERREGRKHFVLDTVC